MTSRLRRPLARLSTVIVMICLTTSSVLAHADTTDPPAPVATSTLIPDLETAGIGPVQSTFTDALDYGRDHPDVGPTGANDWSCRPTSEHPRPVVLVHGTWESAYTAFAALAPALAAEGYCVFALNFGDTDPTGFGYGTELRGTGAVTTSAKEVALFVDAVREATGADQVDAIGHSQGGLVLRQYLRFEGGADPADPARNAVRSVVTVSGSNHGTTLSGVGTLGRVLGDAGIDVLGLVGTALGRAAADQVVGSSVLSALDAGGDTEAGIDYTVIGTANDQIVTPYTSTYLVAGPGATVDNVVLPDLCGRAPLDHLSILYSTDTVDVVLRALGRSGAGSDSVKC